MHIIRGLKNMLPRYRGAVAAIGNFDGVHRGHQTIFSNLSRRSHDYGDVPAMAITFEPHPQQLLHPESAPKRIMRLRAKARQMSRCGVDAMFVLHFNEALAALAPENFVRQFLVDGLAVREVMVGINFRFGARGNGSFADLEKFGEKYGFAVRQQPLLQTQGEAISSTRIRQAVLSGNFALAEQLLGRPFLIEGRVVAGAHRGKGLGFPTANIPLDGILHPPTGVYVVEGWVDDRWLPAVANLGRNPTFADKGMRLEVHFLELCGDIYRRFLPVRFLRFLREEIKFPDVSTLKSRIAQDVAEATVFFLDARRNHAGD